ncbi:TSL-kinase interacting protein 1-like isoform X1 [Papaver somniferum]|uniref:TSL-kinase interacting protein 1-like isoform X1 n=1 Tax=Papaver somniferum TaxID=3469 RepID=UPI000E6F792E|nr:TSL-kinase interacting protein 1-like isoform X1 [Papaver somniferum]
MDMELEEGVEFEGFFQSQSLLIKEAEAAAAAATSPTSCIVDPQKRVRSKAVKRPTRQWAAWTHEEERSFFNALRQVGKNFEKITSRVQSKNKDQVRHYYYRLVRRMNKLLGPDFILDARNFKETNGAMLRWSALLEKYNCKASKLHLKPRRFKIIVEALEQQLLKDRKKYVKKRRSKGEKCSTTTPDTVSLPNKAPAADTGAVTVVAVDSQNVPKGSSGRGSSVKRNVNTGINRKNNKCDLATVKTAKQRKKTGSSSSAAYKKWEKAAMAGVSLVADAAEHLERTTISKETSTDRRSSDESLPSIAVTAAEKGNDPFGVLPLLPLSAGLLTQVPDTCMPPNCGKLKLQLFPIDEDTRKALEKDEHNPFLELTLSARKKISSVLEHLNRKWGKSSIASGELSLFQYDAQRGNLVGHQRWKQDTVASAADVYTVIGSPPLFRLRYGWFSPADLTLVTSGMKEQTISSTTMPPLHDCHTCIHLMKPSEGQQTQIMEKNDVVPSYVDLTDDTVRYNGMDRENIIEDIAHLKSWPGKESGREIIRGPCNDGDNPRRSNNNTTSAGDWADSLTHISIGELLVDQSQAMGINDFQSAAMDSSAFLHQIPFSCDSFDAAIAAHIYGNRDKQDPLSTEVPHASSIWDAEETCDAFSFQKIPRTPIPASFGTSRQTTDTSTMVNRSTVEELREVDHTGDNPICEVDLTNNNPSDAYKVDEHPKDLGGLTDLYWPDSLGPLDLDIPSSRYQDQDLMLGDGVSLTGLNRLIASSLDAFQNCSFFGLDKKDQPPPTTEARGTAAPFLDCKIGGKV